MRERLLSAVILISLGLCANSALSATETNTLETALNLDGTSVSSSRFKVLASPDFDRLIAKRSVPATLQQRTPTCEHGRWFLTRMPNFGNIEKYIPNHKSMHVTRLKFFDESKHTIYRNRFVTAKASNFVNPVNSPSPTPYLESVGRFLELLEHRFELAGLSPNSAC
jgi:hypothetical protein